MRKITPAEIQFFDDNGYVICPGVLAADELATFDRESRRLIDGIVAGGPLDKWTYRGPEGVPYYLTYLHHHPDVLLHHTKVLHGSPVNKSKTLRRVVYFDNRALSWSQKYGWFKPEVMARRCKLYQHALHVRKTRPYASDDEVFNYAPPAGLPRYTPGEAVDLQCKREE